MHSSLSAGKEEFLRLTTDKLGSSPIDFYPRMTSIAKTRETASRRLAAGVLLLLRYRMKKDHGNAGNGEFVFVLIKRSALVPQPGDLSCPGGILHRAIDPLLRPLISTGLLPVMRHRARDLALRKGGKTFRLMTLFLTNAVREAWEEIGLNPFLIRFLGALPSHTMAFYPRTIFPLVAYMANEQAFHPNSEVERIVEIPLLAFLDKSNYGRFTAATEEHAPPEDEDIIDFPCLVHREEEGREEILWGATFYVILNFLKTVIGFRPPDPFPERIVTKVLHPDYMNGRRKYR